jgi:hypothetical protein
VTIRFNFAPTLALWPADGTALLRTFFAIPGSSSSWREVNRYLFNPNEKFSEKRDATVIQRAMHIHPTVSELIPTMLGELEPL